MSTPDITKAQIAAALQAILAVIIAFGIDLTSAQQSALLGLAGILAAGLTLGDAIIRHGRARALTPSPVAIDLRAAQKTAEPTTPPPPAPTPAMTPAPTPSAPPAAPQPPGQPLAPAPTAVPQPALAPPATTVQA